MANIKGKDADGSDIFLKATGAGSDLDPHVQETLDTNSAAILADTANIDTNIGTLAGAVSGNGVQVDVVGSLPAGSNNIGDVDVASLPSLSLATQSLSHTTGTISTSGDNTVIDISAEAGYTSGDAIVITSIVLQNESSEATTAIVKDGVTAIARVLGQNQGDGLAFVFPPGSEWRLSDDADLIVNLSGANSFGYSISYFLEA